MTLKGKKKVFRNAVAAVALVAVLLGIGGVVYSSGNSSIKVIYNNNIWDTKNEFNKEWYMNVENDKIKFIVDLSEYGMEPGGGEEPEAGDDGIEGAESGFDVDGTDGSEGDGSEGGETEEPEESIIEYPSVGFAINEEVNDIIIRMETERSDVNIVDYNAREIEEDGTFTGKYEITARIEKENESLNSDDIGIKVEIRIEESGVIFGLVPTGETEDGKCFIINKSLVKPEIVVEGISEGDVVSDGQVSILAQKDAKFDIKVFKYWINQQGAEEYTELDLNLDYREHNGFTMANERINFTLNEFQDGRYIVAVNATDRAGNLAEEKIVNFVLNKSAPEILFNGESAVNNYYNKSIEVTVKDGSGLDFNNSYVKLIKDGNVIWTGAIERYNKSETEGIVIVDIAEEGNYSLEYEIYDVLTLNNSNTHNFTYDITAPVIKMNVTKEENGEIVKTPININSEEHVYFNIKTGNSISFEAIEANELENFYAEVKNVNTGESNKVILNNNDIKVFDNGQYEVRVKAIDKANNESIDNMINFTVDIGIPEVKINIDSNAMQADEEVFIGNAHDSKVNVIFSDNEDLGKNYKIIVGEKLGSGAVEVDGNKEDDGNTEDVNGWTKVVNESGIIYSKDFNEDGKYVIYAEVSDKAGNPNNKTQIINIDKTNPLVNINIGGYKNKIYYGKKDNKNISVEISDENLVDGYSVKLYKKKNNSYIEENKAIFNKEVSNDIVKFTLEYLTDEVKYDGEYKIEVIANDKGNNLVKIEEEFNVDNKGVTVTFNGVEENEYTNKSVNLSIKLEGSSLKPNSDEVEVSITHNGIVEIDRFSKGSKEYKKILSEEGNYKIAVKGKDSANNNIIDNIEFTIDKTNPVIVIKNYDEFINNPFTAKGRDISFEVADLNLKENSNIVIESASNETHTIAITEGENILEASQYFINQDDYKVTFNIEDNAGNKAVLESEINGDVIKEKDIELKFTVDNEVPVTAIEVLNEGQYKAFENRALLGSGDEKDVRIVVTDKNIVNSLESNVVTITRKDQVTGESEIYDKNLDLEVLSTEGDKVTAIAIKHKFQIDGIYTLNIKSTDKAGNVAKSGAENQIEKDFTFTVDNVSPLIQIYTNDNLTEELNGYKKYFNSGESKVFTVVVSDENLNENTKIEIKKDGSKITKNPLDTTSTDGVATWKYELDEDGKYEFVIESIDGAGNSSKDNENNNKYNGYEFIIDNIKPEVVTTSNASNKIGNKHYFKEDIPNKTVTIKFEDKNLVDSFVENSNENVVIMVNDVDENTQWTRDGDYKNGVVTYSREFSDNGEYVIVPYVIDAAGNSNELAQGAITAIIDNNGPEITIVNPEVKEDKHYGEYVVPVEISIKDSYNDFIEVTFNRKLTDNRFEPIVFNKENNPELFTVDEEDSSVLKFNYNIQGDGEYEIIVDATDIGGNDSRESRIFIIDTTRPVVIIVDYDRYNQNAQDLKFSIIEENYEDYQFKVKSTRFNPETNANEEQVILEALPVKDKREKITQYVINKQNFEGEGTYTVEIEVKDKAGNVGELKKSIEDVIGSDNVSIEFTIDTMAPTITTTCQGTAADLDNVREYKSNKVVIETYDYNQGLNSIEVTKDGSKYDVNGFIINKNKATFTKDFIEEGHYKINVTSTDKSGRTTKQAFEFIIDTTAPHITISNYKEINDSFNNPEKPITITVEELNFNNTQVLAIVTKIKPDGSKEEIPLDFKPKSFATSNTYNMFTEDADYTVNITAKDAAGNIATAENLEIKFTTDKTKPALIIDGIDNDEHYNSDKLVTISSIDNNHEINRVTATRNGQAYSIGDFQISGTRASLSHNFSQEGDYEITVHSKDKAGNEETTSKRFTIDKTAPVITPIFRGENRVIKDGEYINTLFTPEFRLDVSEDKFDFITLNETQNVTGAVPMASTEMVYSYSGQASDKAGNTTTFNITFTVDVTNPEVKVAGIIDGYFNKDLRPIFEITDTNLDTETTKTTLNDKQFASGTKIEDQDFYNLKLEGVDLARNSTMRNIVFALDKDKPVIRFLEPLSGRYFTENVIPQFIIENLTDYTIIAMTLNGEDYEIGDEISTEGKHVLYIEVKDQAGNIESISVEFIIDKTPPKFIIRGVRDKETYVDTVTAEISLENPLDKIIGITVNGELAQGDVKEENGQQVIKLNFNDINQYEVVLNAIDEAGNETEEIIVFKIEEKTVLTTMVANRRVVFPIAAAAVVIVGIVGFTVMRKNKIATTSNDEDDDVEE